MEVDVNLTMGGKEEKFILKKKLMNKWQIRWDNSSTWRWYYSIMQTVGRINCAILIKLVFKKQVPLFKCLYFSKLLKKNNIIRNIIIYI